ncbi:MAG: hypothetical protein HC893_09800 [Chloroflexaceae bacterium]|nr:hypothetical protein [Chloroflexaceae bacterium]
MARCDNHASNCHGTCRRRAWWQFVSRAPAVGRLVGEPCIVQRQRLPTHHHNLHLGINIGDKRARSLCDEWHQHTASIIAGGQAVPGHLREVLFGDAAAAVVGSRSAPGSSSALCYMAAATYSSGADLTVIRGGGTLHHPNDPTTTPEMNLFHMEGPAVFRQSLRELGSFLTTSFDRLNWERRSVDAVVPHQASRHGIELLTRHLGFEESQIVDNWIRHIDATPLIYHTRTLTSYYMHQ